MGEWVISVTVSGYLVIFVSLTFLSFSSTFTFLCYVIFRGKNSMRDALEFFAQVLLRRKLHARCAGICRESVVAEKIPCAMRIRFFAQVFLRKNSMRGAQGFFAQVFLRAI
jgi:hypothetical protein